MEPKYCLEKSVQHKGVTLLTKIFFDMHILPKRATRVSSAGELRSRELQCVWWVLWSYWHWEPQHSWKGWTVLPILFAAASISGSLLKFGNIWCQMSRTTFGIWFATNFEKKTKTNKTVSKLRLKNALVHSKNPPNLKSIASSHQ